MCPGWGQWMTRQSENGLYHPLKHWTMTLPLGVTPILGTACPTGWGKDRLCWPEVLAEGSAVPGSRIY